MCDSGGGGGRFNPKVFVKIWDIKEVLKKSLQYNFQNSGKGVRVNPILKSSKIHTKCYL